MLPLSNDVLLSTDCEILPDESDYEIFRKDRKDGFGGVMLAIKSNTNSNPIDIATVTDCDCEIIASKNWLVLILNFSSMLFDISSILLFSFCVSAFFHR
jgi:hypothetical protein